MNPTIKNSIPFQTSSSQHPKHDSNAIPIDFNGVSDVPDSHAWTTKPSNDNKPVIISSQETLPIIDLAEQDVLEHVKFACEKWGVFQVINHGILVCVFDEIEKHTRRLFSLPMEKKTLAARLENGLTGYGKVRISPFFEKEMWCEGFSIIGSPEVHASKLWPEGDAIFCEKMIIYQQKMKELCEKLVVLILRSLCLTEKEDVKWFEASNNGDGNQTNCLLQLNSYPVCPDPSRAMGMASHTDSSVLTVLYQGKISGLQIYRQNVGWIIVKPVETALVINVGDLMQVISNDRFNSVMHRVMVNSSNHRISVVYFYGPPRDAKVLPLKTLTDHDNPPLYRQVTWNEYLEVRAKHFDHALQKIRL